MQSHSRFCRQRRTGTGVRARTDTHAKTLPSQPAVSQQGGRAPEGSDLDRRVDRLVVGGGVRDGRRQRLARPPLTGATEPGPVAPQVGLLRVELGLDLVPRSFRVDQPVPLQHHLLVGNYLGRRRRGPDLRKLDGVLFRDAVELVRGGTDRLGRLDPHLGRVRVLGRVERGRCRLEGVDEAVQGRDDVEELDFRNFVDQRGERPAHPLLLPMHPAEPLRLRQPADHGRRRGDAREVVGVAVGRHVEAVAVPIDVRPPLATTDRLEAGLLRAGPLGHALKGRGAGRNHRLLHLIVQVGQRVERAPPQHPRRVLRLEIAPHPDQKVEPGLASQRQLGLLLGRIRLPAPAVG
eukprot:m.385794 g.385794  ORF g.385794 m.385794 type:complete len:349 (+) comp28278_c0_seq5:105-1151(+)